MPVYYRKLDFLQNIVYYRKFDFVQNMMKLDVVCKIPDSFLR